MVEKQLKNENGVKSIRFDYLTNNIIIEYDSSFLSAIEIKNKLSNSGYKFIRLADTAL